MELILGNLHVHRKTVNYSNLPELPLTVTTDVVLISF
jgi:hypothetical protein